MTKPYINNAITGNSRMLVCFSDRGELQRLFWPNIDYPQHIEKMSAGILFTGCKNSTMWLNDSCFQHSQQYLEDTNILKTVCTNSEKGLEISQTDFVTIDSDVLVRQFEIRNIGQCEAELGFILYCSCVTTTPELRSTLFDFNTDSLIYYKHGYYIAISSDMEVYQFQLGNNAFEGCQYTELKGNDYVGMMADGALSWKLGNILPGEKKQINIHISASNTLKNAKKAVKNVKNMDIMLQYKCTEKYWQDYIKNARTLDTKRDDIQSLYKRSLLVFKLMSDDISGGLLAAPEIDEDFTKCGRYAYCWGRDAAFITEALDKCGLTEVVDKFYEWAIEVQDEEGSWQQRYHMDGNLAPSWGLQIDETGTLIWGMLKHYEETKNKDFLLKVWDSVERGVNFLINFIDPDTGLPGLSFDLWEERFGEHTYSSAAVCGGIKAGIEISRILGISVINISLWEKAWTDIRDSMIRNLWKEDHHCFLRSIRTKLNPWGSEYSQNTTVVKVNNKGFYRDVTLEDPRVDISLLGISVPFDIFPVDDPRVIETVKTIESVLASPVSGGIRRYEGDNYIGGNPWILTTLWVALYYIKIKDFNKAKEYFEWAVKSRTELDLLPEQVNRETGKPEWVIPLTWSHAMFILVLWELVEAGEI